MDAERAAENQVWLAFPARALVDPDLRALCEKAHDALRSGRRARSCRSPRRTAHPRHPLTRSLKGTIGIRLTRQS